MKQSIDEKLDELLDINNEAEEVVKETNKHLVPRDENVVLQKERVNNR